jgi:cytosine/adenosine deaminase-related metal-dependent hydrolase
MQLCIYIIHLLFPYMSGFVNTHVHTSQQLGKGIADDVDLITWLHKRIWPYESQMTEEDSYLSTLLCGIELIRSGVRLSSISNSPHGFLCKKWMCMYVMIYVENIYEADNMFCGGRRAVCAWYGKSS